MPLAHVLTKMGGYEAERNCQKGLPHEATVAFGLNDPYLRPHPVARPRNWRQTEKLPIGNQFGPSGPDLAFLHIFAPDKNKLEAFGGVFYNLGKRAEEVLANKVPSKNSVDVLVGVIAEGATVIETNKNTKGAIFNTIVCGGTMGSIKQIDDYDLFEFKPTNKPDPSFELPSTYGGASGGALWRSY